MKLLVVIALVFKLLSASDQEVSPKIVGGRDAVENEFPYMVSLRRAELEIIFDQPFHVCGGSIINTDTVLTASHCLYDQFGNHLNQPGSYFVVAGILRMWSDEELEKYFTVNEIFSHPEFSLETLENDIAILKVAPDFTFDLPNIQPISLDTLGEFDEGVNCSTHGWGVLWWGSSFTPDNLQTVNLEISNFDHCNETYEGNVTNNQFCAYEMEKDSCSGDSGGPFVCENMQVGIVSFGYGCAQADIPGVYTKVSAYRHFIENFRNYSTSSATSIYNQKIASACMLVTFFMSLIIK